MLRPQMRTRLVSPWSLVPEDPQGAAPALVVASDITVVFGSRPFVVQRGFRLPSTRELSSGPRFDSAGWLLHSWLYATHGEADDCPLSSHEDADCVLAPESLGTVRYLADMLEDHWDRAYLCEAYLGRTAFWLDLRASGLAGQLASPAWGGPLGAGLHPVMLLRRPRM
eukprot:m51a1_g6810 hypothetical protein (168) ;mRNA; f:262096-262599